MMDCTTASWYPERRKRSDPQDMSGSPKAESFLLTRRFWALHSQELVVIDKICSRNKSENKRIPDPHRSSHHDTAKLHLGFRPPPNPIMLLTARDQMVHIPRIHQARPRLLHIRDPSQAHARLQLILQHPAQMLHALLPVAQTVQERPTDPHGRGPERERLQHVRPPRDAAVDVDFAPAEHVGAHAVQLQQRQQRRLRRVERAAAVIREHDALDAEADGSLRVRGALDALDDDGQAGRLLDPGDVGPAQRFVDVLPHEPAHAAAFLVVGSDGTADGGGYVVGRDALVCFALAGDVGVDGDEDGFDA